MNVARAYNLIRVVGYLSGLLGMGCWLVGRRNGQAALITAGAVALLIMFCCLSGAYLFYMLAPRGRSSHRRAGRRSGQNDDG